MDQWHANFILSTRFKHIFFNKIAIVNAKASKETRVTLFFPMAVRMFICEQANEQNFLIECYVKSPS